MQLNIQNVVSIKFENLPSEYENFFQKEFNLFAKNEPPGEFDIVVSFKNDLSIPSGWQKISNYAGSTPNLFFLLDINQKKICIPFGSLDKKLVVINIEQGYLIKPNDFYVKVLEPIIKLKATQKESSFVHSSSVSLNKKGVLIAAWEHTGKTNLLLELLQNGADFMSDDLTLVDANGQIRAYPRHLNLFDYNFEAFPEIKKILSMKQLCQLKIANTIERLIKVHSTSYTDKLISLLLRFKNYKIIYNKVFPSINLRDHAKLDIALFVTRNADLNKASLEKISSEDFVEMMGTCAIYERRIFENYYLLWKFANPGKKDYLIENAFNRFQAILKSATAEIPTFHLMLPDNNQKIDLSSLHILQE